MRISGAERWPQTLPPRRTCMNITTLTSRPGRKPLPPLMLVAINQMAFPGLGSILAGRRTGWPQAALMVVGFCLTMAFLLWYLWCCARYLREPDWDAGNWYASYAWLFWALHYGLGFCGVAWLWAWIDSIAILRAAKRAS